MAYVLTVFWEINVIKFKKFININTQRSSSLDDGADYLLNLCRLQRLEIQINMFFILGFKLLPPFSFAVL